MRNRNITTITLCIIMIFTCTACWDRHEVEELGLVVAIALDKESGGGEQFVMTAQFVNPNGMGGSDTSSKDTKAYFNLSRSGESVFEIMSDFFIISSRIPNFEHLNVIVINEKVARATDIYKLVHTLLAFWEVPRNTFVLISECEARSLLEIEPELEHLPAFEIDSLLTTGIGTSKKLHKRTFGDLAKDFAAGSSVAIQKLALEETLELKGAAIIRGKENKLAGFLDERETEGLNWLFGEAKASNVTIRDEKNGEIVNCIFSIKGHKIKPTIKEDNISFKVDISADGALAETWDTSSDATDTKYLRDIEEQIAREVEKRIYNTLHVLQKKYKADVADFWKIIKIHDYKLWEEIRDDWDNIFSQADVEVNVDYHIRSFQNRTSK